MSHADRAELARVDQAVQRLLRYGEHSADLANGQKWLKLRPVQLVSFVRMAFHTVSSPAPERPEISADRVSDLGFWWSWLDTETNDALTELARLSVDLGYFHRLDDGADRSPLLERLREGGEQSGRVVLKRLGELLATREGEHLEPQLSRQIHAAQGIVRACLGERRAKQIQRELSDDKALTVCFGRSARRTGLKPPHDTVAFHNGDGCGVVCRDSKRDFRETCPACRPRQFRREARTIAEDMRIDGRPRGLPILGDVDGVPATLWEGWCADCGHHFISTERQTKLCDGCGRNRG